MPKFEIKKFKSQMGHEGPGYYCELWMDGKKVATPVHQGDGGTVYMQYTSREARDAVLAHIKTMPPYHWEADRYSEAHDSPMDEELFMLQLVTEFETRKQFARQCKKWTLFRLQEDKPSEYRIHKQVFTPTIAAGLRKHFGDKLVEIINETLVQETK